MCSVLVKAGREEGGGGRGERRGWGGGGEGEEEGKGGRGRIEKGVGGGQYYTLGVGSLVTQCHTALLTGTLTASR